MSRAARKNLPASVRQHLLVLSRKRGQPFDLILVRFGIERLLYRLGRSAHADNFLLKGAMLFAVWGENAPRPTRDLDFLGFGPVDADEVKAKFTEICGVSVEPDGLEFLSGSVVVGPIRDAASYPGLRITLEARLANIRIPLQVDIGYGDAVTPGPVEAEFPALLDFPAPRIRAYPPATVVAEKLEAMVRLGLPNTRLKDFFDLWYLSRRFTFDGPLLTAAVTNTFARRRTTLPPDVPVALTVEFATQKAGAWETFLRRNTLEPVELPPVIAAIGDFVMPVLTAASGETPLTQTWQPKTGWK